MSIEGEDIRWKSADGLDLYARSYGPSDARLTVLCMHGLTRNHKDFEPMIAALPGHFRFIAVDVRGRGLSARDADAKNYSPFTYAADMAALLDYLNIYRVALIGTSMGGLMSMIMMKTMPQRIRGVVLNDVGPVFEASGLKRIAAYTSDTEPKANWDEAAAAVGKIQADTFPDFGPDNWMALARRTFRELEDGRVALDYDPAITRTISKVRPGLLTRIAMWRLFRKMTGAPLLVVRGERSDILSEKTAAEMIKRHPDAERVTVPRVGHAPILDEPEAIRVIGQFLSKVEPRA
ncbi:alpha/beta hydrolase [Hyphomonas sp.]|uniref:alpha/beta fold hydrolase n=1 Tax=Hyphomonas sp. TaxID=87 RepID=UPI0032EFB5A6